jgi:hypothetical protein
MRSFFVHLLCLTSKEISETARGRGCLQPGNARAHNAKRSRQEVARAKAIKVVHPVYCPDATPNDFFLFGHLKCEMVSFIASSPAGILSEIRRIFQEISKETLVAEHDEWIIRPDWITEYKGEYYHAE